MEARFDATPEGYRGQGGKITYADEACEIKTGVTLIKDGVETSFKDAISIQITKQSVI